MEKISLLKFALDFKELFTQKSTKIFSRSICVNRFTLTTVL